MNYIYGAGGHGKVVLDALQKAGQHCVAFVDDRPLQEWARLPVVTPDNISPSGLLHFAIGNSAVREKLAVQWAAHRFFSIHHPQAAISASARIDQGTLIAALAIVGPDARIGAHCIINHGAIIDHDCIVGDYVHVAPNATLGGGVHLGRHVLIGAGAVVLPGIRITDHVTIGAGAVVTRDVLHPGVLIGTPARPLTP